MPARILVVDDTPANVRLMEAKLTAEYFDVASASSGPEALAAISEHMPDVVLLDVMMPGMDGYEVCRALRADPKTRYLPVIMVTALGDPADKLRGLDAGADDFLTKPVGDLALLARIRSLVRYKTTMDEWRIRQSTAGMFFLEQSAEREPQIENHENAQILLVEPAPRLAESIIGILSKDHHRPVIARNVASALEAATATPFDVVITELHLESEDGLRLVSHLRSRVETRQWPILLIAESADGARVLKGLDIGASDYLIKPIDANELLARVRIQVRRRRYQDRLREDHERSLSMALTDGLTGLYNRRYAMRHLQNLLRRVEQTKKPLAVIACDLDHFKSINDTYGHAAGDKVLQQFAKQLANSVRPVDMVARFGGEEFVVLLPDIAGIDAVKVAQRICENVGSSPMLVEEAGFLPITVSAGVAGTAQPMDADTLLKLADAALYRAKNNGRNQAVADPGALLM